MAILTITLSNEEQEFLDEQVAAGSHESAEAYVRDVLEKERLRAAKEKLEAMLLEGLEGESVEVTPEWWADFRKRMYERHKARNAS
jgi:antitoxin ParD1/3/4